jgi:O-antigen/teichoic acid export membrane protein
LGILVSKPPIQPLQEDSLRKRFSYKVVTGVINLPLGFCLQAMVSRALGPSAYGSYAFLTSFFNEIFGFFDSGTSTGLFAKMCQRPAESALLTFYWRFTCVVGCVVGGFVLASYSAGLGDKLWPKEELLFIALAAISVFLTWALKIAGQAIDAYGLTARAEQLRLLHRVFSVALVALLFWLGSLSLFSYLLLLSILAVILFFLWNAALQHNGMSLWPSNRLDHATIRTYTGEFWQYCQPLFAYTVMSLVTGLADRWLLQVFAGSTEQGFFALSQQISTVCLVLTSAMSPLLFREFAKAHGNSDFVKMQRDFARYVPLFFCLTACFCAFLSSQAKPLALLLGGSEFEKASVPLAITCFFPVYQTYGWLSGSFFTATGQTKTYRNIGIISMTIGIGLTGVLIGPAEMGGLGLGATGLSLKTILTWFCAVNLQLWLNTKQLGLSFSRFFINQILVISLFLALAILCGKVFDFVTLLPLLHLGLSALLYFVVAFALAYLMPAWFGIPRQEFERCFRIVRGIILKRGRFISTS